MDSFINNNELNFVDYFEEDIEKNLINKEDYINLNNEIIKISDQYSKTSNFLQNGVLENLKDEELQAILDILDLKEQMRLLEYKEAYKLGLKDAYVFFKEMKMLNE